MTPVNITSVLTSEIANTFEVHKPAKRRSLLQKYGNQGADFMQIMIDTGKKRGVAAESESVYEDTWYHQLVKVKANVAAPGAGTDLVFKLAADNIPAGGFAPYVRPGDVLMLLKDEKVGNVISVVANGADWDITLRPNGTDNIGVLANDQFAIISGAWGERTVQPDPTISPVYEYTAYLQIIKETSGTSGTEMTNQVWFDMREDGASTPSYWSVALLQGEYRLAVKIEGAMLFNKKTENVTLDVANTQGIIPEMKSGRGHLHPTGGAFVLADINDMNAYYDTVFGGLNQIGLVSGKRMQQIEDEMTTQLTNTGTSRAAETMSKILFEGTSKDVQNGYGFNYHVSYIEKGGRNYGFMKLQSLDNPTTYNTAASLSRDYGYFFGAERQRDAKGGLQDHFGLLFKENNGYSRYMETWQWGSAGPGLKLGATDEKLIYHRSHIGVCHFKLEQTILMTN